VIACNNENFWRQMQLVQVIISPIACCQDLVQKSNSTLICFMYLFNAYKEDRELRGILEKRFKCLVDVDMYILACVLLPGLGESAGVKPHAIN
jgi:hypothetical protein